MSFFTNDAARSALVEVLEFLVTLQVEGVRPQAARVQLQALRAHHPELVLDLLSEEEAYDGSVDYDVLLRRAGEATVSLSYCREPSIPWPLRGVHRWSEADLVRVNAKVLKVDQAVACLDFIWDHAPIVEQLIHTCLIQEELEREPIELSDAELQAAMNAFRKAKKLFRADDTLRWLERHGMTQEALERYVTENALAARLRKRIAADRVEEYFRQHPGDFDSVSIARLEVADEGEARELAQQIRGGQQDFFAVAESQYLKAVEQSAPVNAGPFATIERRQVAPALRELLFAAQKSELVGPIPAEPRFALLRVLGVHTACLDARTRDAIEKVLFEEWLAQRRQAARIEWCWGNASRTG